VGSAKSNAVSPFGRFLSTPLQNTCDIPQGPIVRQIGWTCIALTACAMKSSNRIANPPLSCCLSWIHQRAQGIPPTSSKKCHGACFFKVQFVSLGIVNSKPPMNKLPFKTADFQGQIRQPNFQSLSIQILTDWRGI